MYALVQDHVIWSDATIAGFDILVFSLRNSPAMHYEEVYLFLDNCLTRCATKTVVYADRLDNLIQLAQAGGEAINSQGLPDLLMIVLMEQLPYLTAKQSDETVQMVVRFLKLYIDSSLLRGGSKSLLSLIRDTMIESLGKSNGVMVVGHALQEPLDDAVRTAFDRLLPSSTIENDDGPTSAPLMDRSTGLEVSIPPGPPIEDENHRGITQWAQEDIQDAVANGAVGELFLCLCSVHEDIRRAAMLSISGFMQKLEVRSPNYQADHC